MKKKINIGLVGLGRLGRHYADYIAHQIRGATLFAIADIDEFSLTEVSEEYGVSHAYSDYHELLSNNQVHAIVIVTSTSIHQEIIVESAKQGKAIFCEKPLTLSLQEGQKIRSVLDETSAFLQMGFMRRFDKGYAAGKRKVDQNEIGSPVLFRASSRDPYRPSLEYLNPDISGGIFVDMGIHDFDLARWFIGEIESVYSSGGVLAYPEMEPTGDIDNAVASLRFENGTLGVIDLTRNGVYGYDIRTEILGTAGTIKIGYLRETPLQLLKKEGVCHDAVPFFMERFGPAYVAQLQDFVDNLLNSKPPAITCEDGIEALRIALAARLSYLEDRPVRVAEIS